VVIIGFGSPIRGDDALGPLVADRLAEELELPQVEVFSRHILTAELAERLQDATLAVFLDASLEGPPGRVVQRELVPDTSCLSAMAHALNVGELLAWTRELYGRTPQAVLFSTRGVTFEYAAYRLSSPVAATVRPLMDGVTQLVLRHLQEA
jgi:hydrogenase maturation protease